MAGEGAFQIASAFVEVEAQLAESNNLGEQIAASVEGVDLSAPGTKGGQQFAGGFTSGLGKSITEAIQAQVPKEVIVPGQVKPQKQPGQQQQQPPQPQQQPPQQQPPPSPSDKGGGGGGDKCGGGCAGRCAEKGGAQCQTTNNITNNTTNNVQAAIDAQS